jgi:hypothetical protein
MQLTITDNQYRIVMNALEKYYYFSKKENYDEGILDEINQTECNLMFQGIRH